MPAWHCSQFAVDPAIASRASTMKLHVDSAREPTESNTDTATVARASAGSGEAGVMRTLPAAASHAAGTDAPLMVAVARATARRCRWPVPG